MNKKRRWQFGLLALAVVVSVFAVAFALLRPAVFPSDDLIRQDLGIPTSIAISVFDRQTVRRDGFVVYGATVHVAEKPHRLVRVSCNASTSLTDREPWAPVSIHDHYGDGSFEFRMCERRYEKAPTEAEIEEFRQFAANFR